MDSEKVVSQTVRRVSMSARRAVSKYFRIHPVLKQMFERFCGALGLDQSDVLEKLIAEWCDRQKDPGGDAERGTQQTTRQVGDVPRIAGVERLLAS